MRFLVIVRNFLMALVTLKPIRLSFGVIRDGVQFEYYFQAGAPA